MTRRSGEWRHSRALLILPVASLAALSMGTGACGHIVGLDDYETGGAAPAPSACGLPYGTTVCASCVATSCCGESSACAISPSCAAHETCLSRCGGDPSCRAQCTLAGFAASREVSALSACLTSSCETACGLVCGGVGAYLSEPALAASCQSCFTDNASVCDRARACFSSVDCDAFVRCSLAAQAPFGAACSVASDAGAPQASPVVQDWNGTCASQCAAGGRWSCVGHKRWQGPTSSTVTLTLLATDFDLKRPVSGLDVSVHSYTDTDGSRPLLQDQTNADGSVVFVMENSPDGAGLGLNGYWKLAPSSLGYGLQFLWWGFPLSTAVFSYTTTLAPESLTEGLFTALGMTLDRSRGNISAKVFDCVGNPAPDVEVTLDVSDPLTRRIYGNAPNASFTATDQTGMVFFLNAPVGGLPTITATPRALLGRASSRQSILVRANAWNYMPLPVTP